MESKVSSCLLVFAGVLLAYQIESGVEAHRQAAPNNKADVVTVKGVVTNLAEGKERITGDTYLQLVFLPPDGKLDVRAEAGRISFTSSLPRASMPTKGPFSFEGKGLGPGTYLLAVQKYAFSTDGFHPFLRKDGQPLEIKISDSTPSVLDVGEVTLPVPPR